MEEVLLGDRVELSRGLVEQKQARPHGERARQRHHLLLPARQLGDVAAEPGLDAEEVRRLGDASAHGVLRHAEVLQPEGQLVPHGIAHDLVLGTLRHVAHGHGRFARVEAVDGAPERLERPRAVAHGRDGRFQAPHQRGLPAARSAHQQLERAFFNPPIERADARRGTGVGEREPARLHRRHARHLKRSFAVITIGKAANSAYGR